MSSITFKRGVLSAGTSFAVDQIVTSLSFAAAIAFVQANDAVWTSAPNAVPLPDSLDEAPLVNVTATTGGTPAALDGYTTSHLPLGRTFRCVIGARKCVYQLKAAGSNVADGNGIIQPPDFDATSNNRLLVQIL